MEGNNYSSFLKSQIHRGLSEKEVKQRVLKGEVNTIPKAPSRTIGQMIRANFFNIFTFLNIALALVCVLVGSPKNAIFAGVIIINSLIGVGQELSARSTLDKLSLLSMAKAKVIRGNKVKEIAEEDIVLNDIVYLSSGNQVLADCILSDGDELEVDESMLTGESDPVCKVSGDSILSGSFIVAGEGVAEVSSVGKNTYSSQLAEEARKFKIINSELQYAITKIIKLLLWLIVPIGVILILTQLLFSEAGLKVAILGAVSGVIGMIPEGLVLLTSATFIVSVVKLSKYETLVQQLSATEVLARVDVLCADKTGTITEGTLSMVGLEVIGQGNREKVDKALSTIVHNLPSKNPTQQAILQWYQGCEYSEVDEKVPFSSKRKWGGILCKDGGWILGAPEILLGNKYEDYRTEIEREAKKGRRVLIIGEVHQETLKGGITSTFKEEALIFIEDVIKKEAPEVLKFFKEEGVNLKVISGDNPITVSAVAMRAGLEDYDKYVDARNLPEDINELATVIDKYSVFGRVTPHQKKDIISALKLKGHTVAMTGDGVNDVLALKESDCGIAMGNGSDATKAVAQLVLMNSDFKSLPYIVQEGRKQINNLERVAELFLTKTVFFVLLAFIFSALMMPYPLLPIQASLVGSCAIGIPAFFLALLPSEGRVKKGFLKRILITSVPNGSVMVILTTIGYVMSYMSTKSVDVSRSVALAIFGGISLVILIRITFPLTKFKLGLVCGMVAAMVVCFITPIGREVFSLTTLDLRTWIFVFGLSMISWPLISFSVRGARLFFRSKSRVQIA